MTALIDVGFYIHPMGTSRRVTAMFNFEAYGDESETDGQVFCVAAYVASERDWTILGDRWETALDGMRAKYGKPFLEFKMYDCVAGENNYEDLTIPEREDIQNRFIQIINSINHVGVCSAVHLRAFDKMSVEEKQRLCRVKKYEKPYFLSFNHVIFVAGKLLLDLDRHERLTGIFDESNEYQGRAKELWDDLKRHPVTKLVPVAHRMGTLTHADSKSYPGLQAADILAYESRRYFMEVSFNTFPNEERWQWTALNASHYIDVYPIGRKALKLLYGLDDFL